MAHIRVADRLELVDDLVDGCKIVIPGHEVQLHLQRRELFLSQLHPFADALAHFLLKAGAHLGGIALQLLRFIFLENDRVEAHLADGLLKRLEFIRCGCLLGLPEQLGLITSAALMDHRDHCFSGYIAADHQDICLVLDARGQELAIDRVRTVKIRTV